jgi:ATP-dependent Clp protease protease subunit
MIHDPLITGDCGGPALSVDAISKRLTRTRRKVGEILSQCTGRPLDAVLSATARDTFFDAQQAKAFGLVDEIIADWGELRHVG